MFSQAIGIALFVVLFSSSDGQVDLFDRKVKEQCDAARSQVLSSSERIMENWDILEVHKKVFEGDMIVTDDQKKRWKVSGYLKGNKSPLIQEKWPGNTVTYRIGSPAPHLSLVKAAMNEWSSRTCIKFVEGTNNALTIFKGEGCYAQLGYSGRKEMSVSDLCDKGTVVHLLGHVIGLVHQHSRPDRDNYLAIQYHNTAITDIQYLNYKDYDKCPYDFNSVMHFDMFGLSYNGESVFYGKSKHTDGVMFSSGIGTNWDKPTDSDVALVNREYGCEDKPCGILSVRPSTCNREFSADYFGAQKMFTFRDIIPHQNEEIRCIWKAAVTKRLKCSRAAIAVSLGDNPSASLKRAWFASGCRLLQVEIYDPDMDMTHLYCAAQFARKPTKVFIASDRTIYAIIKLHPTNWQNFITSAVISGYVKMFNIKDFVCLGEINGKCT